MNNFLLQTWRSKVEAARFVVAITGAGISSASGLPLIEQSVADVSLRDFFRPDLLIRRPKQYYDIYRSVLLQWRSAAPNRAHVALANFGVWVITQNIDGLHRDAGTGHLIELHGNLRELRCPKCDTKYNSALVWRESVPFCPGCSHVLYPGVTLEGEEVRHFARAVDWVGRAEVVLVIGTNLNMHPVLQLPRIAKDNGATVMVINCDAETILPELFSNEARSPTRFTSRSDESNREEGSRHRQEYDG